MNIKPAVDISAPKHEDAVLGVIKRLPIRPAAQGHQSAWQGFRDHFRYWIWQLFSKAILGVIYLAVISEGLRVLIPALGHKIYKLPGLSGLRDFEATCRLDLAPFFAVFLLIAVFVLWPRIILIWTLQQDQAQWSREQQLVVGLGAAILGTDAILFYYAMTQMAWGSSTFSFAALVATAAYVGVLVFVSWMSIKLHPRRKDD